MVNDHIGRPIRRLHVRTWKWIGVSAFCVFTLPAAAIDIEQSIAVVGSTSQYKLNEEEANSDTDTLASIGLGYQIQWDRINKLSMEWRPIDASFGAAANHLSADAEGNQISLYWSHKARLAKAFKPWLSAGVRTTSIDVSNKQRIDGDGFVVPADEPIEDRKGTDVAVMVAASVDWNFDRDWSTELQISYDQPLSDGLQGFGLAAMLRYQF